MQTNSENIFRQVLVFTKANLKTRYRKTWAGFLWVILSPVIVFSVQATIFSHVLKISVSNYSLFFVAALLPWIFIVQTSEMCAPLIVNSASLMKAFPINPLVFITAQIFDNLINFLASVLIVILPVAAFSSSLSWSAFLIPIPILIIVPAVVSLSVILALLQVYFADTRFVLSFLFSILYFLTPIFYPLELLPSALANFVEWNPLFLLIQTFRACLFNFELQYFLWVCLKGFTASIFLTMAAYSIWNWKKDEIYFRI